MDTLLGGKFDSVRKSLTQFLGENLREGRLGEYIALGVCLCACAGNLGL